MKPAYLPFILLLSILCGACSNDTDPVFRDQFFAIGTLIDLTFYGVDPMLAAQASTRLEQDFLGRHDDWHAWQPGPLGRTNQLLETTAWFSANPSVLPIIAEGRALSLKSGGLFNPAVGHLIRLWGFQRDELRRRGSAAS